MLESQLSKPFSICPKALWFTGRDRQVDGQVHGVIFAAERYTGNLYLHPHKKRNKETNRQKHQKHDLLYMLSVLLESRE